MSNGVFERDLVGESKRKFVRVTSGIGMVQRDFIGMMGSYDGMRWCWICRTCGCKCRNGLQKATYV